MQVEKYEKYKVLYAEKTSLQIERDKVANAMKLLVKEKVTLSSKISESFVQIVSRAHPYM